MIARVDFYRVFPLTAPIAVEKNQTQPIPRTPVDDVQFQGVAARHLCDVTCQADEESLGCQLQRPYSDLFKASLASFVIVGDVSGKRFIRL